MTSLENLGISKNRIGALNKKGIFSVEDVQTFFPRKYYDFTKQESLKQQLSGEDAAIIGKLEKVTSDKKNNTLMLKAKVVDEVSGKTLHIMWIGSYYLKNIIKEWEGERVIACGQVTYFEQYSSYHMKDPVIFDRRIDKNLKVYTVYKKMSGISEEFMDQTITAAMSLRREETLPVSIRDKYHLMELNSAIHAMHRPVSMKEIEQAKKRFTYEKLFSFAVEIEKEEHSVSKGTIYNIKSLEHTSQYINDLPFELTDSQKAVFEDMKKKAVEGVRINALVQGDVGSGKTVQAFLMMFAMADSGYQSVLMAPTQILAKQHYEKIKESAEKYGYKAAYITGETKGKEKKNLLAGIAGGEYTFVIGTHSVLSSSIVYHKLALVVIDEEHKFGVSQRNQLTDKAKDGVHIISMSGTPIPRTLASTLYGASITVYDLKLPEGRKQTQTAIFNNAEKICKFIYQKSLQGQQAYIVCPWIEDAGDNKYEVDTVESVFKEYSEFFKMYPDIKIGKVTGKMKAEECDKVLEDFSQGKLQILISTTVIEVGVNVPKANIIVIHNADRFGLAQLHQLRGRVGRGSDQGYCILKSPNKENERLQIMCRTTNGLEIAQEDMRLRGTGNLLGTEQSGRSEYIDLILKYPNMYQYAKTDAKEQTKLE